MLIFCRLKINHDTHEFILDSSTIAKRSNIPGLQDGIISIALMFQAPLRRYFLRPNIPASTVEGIDSGLMFQIHSLVRFCGLVIQGSTVDLSSLVLFSRGPLCNYLL